jgi:hypothetical protein
VHVSEELHPSQLADPVKVTAQILSRSSHRCLAAADAAKGNACKRRGEAVGVRWEDLHLDGKYLHVAKRIVQLGSGHRGRHPEKGKPALG